MGADLEDVPETPTKERAQSPDIAKRPRSRSRSRSLSPGRHSKKCRQHSPSHSPLSKNIQCARHELKADMRMYLQANPKSKSVTRMLTGLVHYEAALAQIDSDPESAVEQLAQAFLTDDSAIHPVEHVASFKKAAHQRLQRAHADLPALLVLSQLQSPDTRLALYDRCLRALADPSNAAWKHWAARIFELRGLCHGRVGEFEDALCDYRLAVAAFGTTVWAPYSIGVCLNVLGRPVEGAESADSADSADSVDSAETAAAAECIAALQDFVAGAEEDAILLPDALYLLALLQLQERLGVPYLEPDCLQGTLDADVVADFRADVAEAQEAERRRCPFFPRIDWRSKQSVERILAVADAQLAHEYPTGAEVVAEALQNEDVHVNGVHGTVAAYNKGRVVVKFAAPLFRKGALRPENVRLVRMP